ncbi:hypothetical protein [uncultured Tateyamaria sp.]|uniref:hypothetical protein n=1 Tax=uncultured Tateyamaria sp. TaxID=455651 RepID=UPI002610CA56|nr:hypothetical protein [uncultured Tateyamaria sp.]
MIAIIFPRFVGMMLAFVATSSQFSDEASSRPDRDPDVKLCMASPTPTASIIATAKLLEYRRFERKPSIAPQPAITNASDQIVLSAMKDPVASKGCPGKKGIIARTRNEIVTPKDPTIAAHKLAVANPPMATSHGVYPIWINPHPAMSAIARKYGATISPRDIRWRMQRAATKGRTATTSGTASTKNPA